MTRRAMLFLGGALASVPLGPFNVLAQSAAGGSPVTPRFRRTHGISAFGDLAYGPDFTHFAYVNPDAPKGGLFSQIGATRQYNQSFQTFNTLNSYILKGDAALGMELTFASLMARDGDSPDAMYGLAASHVEISDDGTLYRFHMRSEASFHDGTRLRAQDAAFSLELLKEKGHPIIRQLMRDVLSAKALDDRVLEIAFTPKRARDVPLFVAALPIFSQVYYSKKNFEESSLDIPLGSGPYRVGNFEPGHHIEYNRVKDWWGKKLPCMRGQHNFDVVRYEFYRDRDVAFEGFTGKSYLFREEFTARVWATRYDFPAIKDGRVKRETMPDDTPSGAQGWFMNLRRPQFSDARVREAFINAFDFEWTRKTVMYGAYERTSSPFQNSDLMAQGAPSAQELALLEPFRAQLPAEVFAAPFSPPVSDGSGQDRVLLRKANHLLNEAGCMIREGKRMTQRGEPMQVEFLIDEPTFKPHHMPYIKNLATLGIDANLRIVDPTQYQARVNDFDFDITVKRFSMSSTPGEEMRSFFSSQSASLKGSNNLSGIADPVLDRLIDMIVAAQTREELQAACRAFDRVFRSGRYWIPHWFKGSHNIAYWDVFAHPARKPRYARGVPETWWLDASKAAGGKQAG